MNHTTPFTLWIHENVVAVIAECVRAALSPGAQYTASTPGSTVSTRACGAMRSTRAASIDDLVRISRPRIEDALRMGTTTMEIKSGYGLDVENELKILRAIYGVADSGAAVPSLMLTFLGAHAVPQEYRGRQDEYVDLVITQMIPAVAALGYVSFVDVFCDQGYFTNDETARICAAAATHELRAKLHVDELADTDGAKLAARIGALSADHLERVNPLGIAALGDSKTVATLLPGTAYFLGFPYPPARDLIDRNCIVALATDFNPGSTPSYSMQLAISMACTQMKLTVEEAITAATLNGAAALGIGDRVGSIEPGKSADLIVCAVRDYREVGYWFGGNIVRDVVHGGHMPYAAEIW